MGAKTRESKYKVEHILAVFPSILFAPYPLHKTDYQHDADNHLDGIDDRIGGRISY